MTHKVGTALLTAIDAGNLAPTVAPDDPAFWLLAAEAAAMVGNAEEALDDLARAGELEPALRRRADCLRAELSVEAGDTATAEGLAYSVLSDTTDRSTCVRARLAVVRVKVRDGRYRSALDDLPRLRREIDADEGATDEQRVFRKAICDHLEAYSSLKLGDSSAALAGAHRAIGEFVRLGAGRWEGWARGILGLAMLERGEFDSALREFERSETCAAALGMVPHMLMARNNCALVMMASGRVGDAATALRASLATETGTVADVQCRMLLALALGTLQRKTEARTAARKAVEIADELAHEETGGDARILVTWLDGNFDRLHQLLKRAEQRGRPFQVRLALVCMADLEPASKPDRAERLLARADELTERADELSPLIERIRARLGVAAIRVEGGALVIDTSRGVPHLDDAVEAVERMLLDAAMKRGDYVQRRAAGLLGISPTRILYLRRKLGKMAD